MQGNGFSATSGKAVRMKITFVFFPSNLKSFFSSCLVKRRFLIFFNNEWLGRQSTVHLPSIVYLFLFLLSFFFLNRSPPFPFLYFIFFCFIHLFSLLIHSFFFDHFSKLFISNIRRNFFFRFFFYGVP